MHTWHHNVYYVHAVYLMPIVSWLLNITLPAHLYSYFHHCLWELFVVVSYSLCIVADLSDYTLLYAGTCSLSGSVCTARTHLSTGRTVSRTPRLWENTTGKGMCTCTIHHTLLLGLQVACATARYYNSMTIILDSTTVYQPCLANRFNIVYRDCWVACLLCTTAITIIIASSYNYRNGMYMHWGWSGWWGVTSLYMCMSSNWRLVSVKKSGCEIYQYFSVLINVPTSHN